VVPAARKETGWWTENIGSSPHHVSLAGYGLKYFRELDEAMASFAINHDHTTSDGDFSGCLSATQSHGGASIGRPRTSMWGRRLDSDSPDDARANCGLITGEVSFLFLQLDVNSTRSIATCACAHGAH
jgi:hypothetical protein